MVSTQARGGGMWGLLAAVLVLLVGGCYSGGAAVAPTITSLTPDSVPLFAPETVVTVRGTGFTNGAVVFFDGFPNPTTLENSAELTARVSNSLFTSPRTIKVRVQIPGGTTSEPFDFIVGGNNPVPVINSISPTTTAAQGSAFAILIEGSNFVVDSVAQWNDSNRGTSFESTSRIRVFITEEDIANTGTAQITVFNPLPGGGRSSARTFTIVNPVATISTLNPADKLVGDAGFDLEVNGSGMVQGSIVRFNGANRATTFVDKNKARAAIPTSDLVTAGVFQITVFNPPAGGGVSAPATFTVRNPVPSVGALTPSSRAAGSGGFTLTVDGSNFVSGSVVNWNGSANGVTIVTFVNSTRLTAQINSQLVAMAGTAQVTVVSPEPGGGTSAPVTFTITPGAAGVVARISVSYAGSEADGDSRNSAISGDGRWVVFESDATNLAPGDTNGITDIFLRDTCMGPFAPENCVPVTTRVSVAPGGGQFFAPSRNPSISADGRFIAFESDTDFALPAPPGIPTRVLLHDTCNGAEVPGYCLPTTWRFTLGDKFFSPLPANSIRLAGISADGRTLALFSALVDSEDQVFLQSLSVALYESCTTALSTSSCLSVLKEALSSDWIQSVWNSVVPLDTHHGAQVLPLRDIQDSIRQNLCGFDFGLCGNTSEDSRTWVGPHPFSQEDGMRPQVVVHFAGDGTRGAMIMLSKAADSQLGNGASLRPAISADGRWAVFQSFATNLVPNDTNGRSDIFLARTGR